MLQTYSLTYQYPKSSQIHWPDLELNDGEALVILGPSGSGKTTLLHLLAGLLKPKSGSVKWDELDLTALTNSEFDQFRGSHLGLLFQQTHYWSALSVLENLQLATNLCGKEIDESALKQHLADLGIDQLAHKKPQHCSIGERQRLGVAMASAHQPKLLLADEPTSALDDKNCHRVLDMLENITLQNGRSLLIITHDKRVTDRFSKVVKLEESA